MSNFILLFVRNSDFGCFNGTQGSEQLVECPTGLDRCAYFYPDLDTGFAGFACANQTLVMSAGFTDNTCSTVTTNGMMLTACICDTTGCNKELSVTNGK